MSNVKILISACLVGQPVRYDGKSNHINHDILEKWQVQGLLLPLCPEVSGGLQIPRAPAEIQINGKIKTQKNVDVTAEFQQGAEIALKAVLKHKIKVAVLTEKSPSCGGKFIYNGQFNRTLIEGKGLTAKLLEDNGIKVFNQFELVEADDYLQRNQECLF